MASFVELRRHAANVGGQLTDVGIVAALDIGSGLGGGYRLGVSSGVQSATQTLACFLAGLGERLTDGVRRRASSAIPR